MFGTFQSEFATEEKVQYGLVQNIRSFDPTYIQFGYLQYVLTKSYSTAGIKNKLNVLVMGPGYNPAQPEYRLGDPTKIPEIDSKYKFFDPEISTPMKIYAFVAGVHANLLFEAAQVKNTVGNSSFICGNLVMEKCFSDRQIYCYWIFHLLWISCSKALQRMQQC